MGKYCEEKMPGTKFDKFFVDELVKKYAKQDVLDELFNKIRDIKAPVGDEYVDEFRQLVDSANYAKDKELQNIKDAKLAAEAQ